MGGYPAQPGTQRHLDCDEAGAVELPLSLSSDYDMKRCGCVLLASLSVEEIQQKPVVQRGDCKGDIPLGGEKGGGVWEVRKAPL